MKVAFGISHLHLAHVAFLFERTNQKGGSANSERCAGAGGTASGASLDADADADVDADDADADLCGEGLGFSAFAFNFLRSGVASSDSPLSRSKSWS